MIDQKISWTIYSLEPELRITAIDHSCHFFIIIFILQLTTDSGSKNIQVCQIHTFISINGLVQACEIKVTDQK
jgi:AAA15 family ATPase/GTPase